MAFDDKKFNSTAINGEVAGIAIYASIALHQVRAALMAMKLGEDPAIYLKGIEEVADKLDAKFNELTGWTQD